MPLDDNKLIQVLINLGANALEAMPKGGELTFVTTLENNEVVLTVRDTGIGLATEDVPRIFEPFFSRKSLGLGFGLAIVQKIIEDHGGIIQCRSEEKRGTTFDIRFKVGDEKKHSDR